MANTKSAQKNIRKTQARTLGNRVVKSRLRTLAKKVAQLSTEKSEASAQAAAEYASALDKAVKRGVIHRNKANRHKSAIASLVHKAG